MSGGACAVAWSAVGQAFGLPKRNTSCLTSQDAPWQAEGLPYLRGSRWHAKGLVHAQ
jgi:hypothetical protein